MIGTMTNYIDSSLLKILKYTNSYQALSTAFLYIIFMLMGAGESLSALFAFILPIYATIVVDDNNAPIDIRPNLSALIIIMAIQLFLYVAIETTIYIENL